MVIHDERLIDRLFSLSVPRFVPFRVSLLYLALLFPLLPVLCPEPLLPCGQRQGNIRGQKNTLFLGSNREWSQQTRDRKRQRRLTLQVLERRVQGKPVAKARPRRTSNLTLSPVSIPYRERKWIDIGPGKFDKSCLEVSKMMIRLLRHDDSICREEDGAVSFDREISLLRTGQFGHG